MEEKTIQIIVAPDGCENAKGICAVFDVLRASSVECHLHLVGAKKVFPQESIEETLKMKQQDKNVILLGERDGDIIPGCDLGNSPSAILNNAEKIKGKVCYHNTTAGTQAFNEVLKNKKYAVLLNGNSEEDVQSIIGICEKKIEAKDVFTEYQDVFEEYYNTEKHTENIKGFLLQYWN